MAKTKDATEVKKISKMEAVRQTLAVGIVKPLEGIESIKEKFGHDIPAQVFSSYKSQINKSAGKTPGKRGRKPGRPAGSTNAPAMAFSSPAKPAASSAGNGIALARDVKKLVDQYGADAVKGMADVFGG